MTRLEKFLLMLLGGLGWGSGFALIGLGLLKGVPDNAELAAVFAAFGFAAGALLVPLRLALEARSARPVVPAQGVCPPVRQSAASVSLPPDARAALRATA